MRCFTLSDGKYMVEVPVNKGVINLMLTPDALMRNFQLDTLPVETVFDAEPRDVQDYLVRPQSPRNKVTDISVKIRELRKREGLTQEAFARILGLGRTGAITVSAWETGKYTPGTANIQKIKTEFDFEE